MSKPYMRWYWGDWFANTKDLSHEEKGAYMDLIGHYWERGGLPTDPKRLAKIIGLTPHKATKILKILSQFFDEEWKHKKIEKELAYFRERSMKAREAAQRMLSIRSANAQRTLQRTLSNAGARLLDLDKNLSSFSSEDSSAREAPGQSSNGAASKESLADMQRRLRRDRNGG